MEKLALGEVCCGKCGTRRVLWLKSGTVGS